ncbi:SMP-30/gluconolactonase/LRE family protein, partial [Candidatus Aerophobetes bacterium]
MVFAKGLSIPEGPVVLPDKSFLVVEMGTGYVTHITQDGQKKKMIAEMGRPNGLAVDRNGVIWVAESQPPSLVRLSMNGETQVWLTECDGEPFLFPNDLAFGPDGALYMTDSGILIEEWLVDGGVRPDYMDLKIDGHVYKIDVNTKKIEKLNSEIRFTNGIAFGPDDNLYVNETLTGAVYRYKWKDGKVGSREDIGNVMSRGGMEGVKGPDGMKFGKDGNLYVAVFGQSNVTVLNLNGTVVER